MPVTLQLGEAELGPNLSRSDPSHALEVGVFVLVEMDPYITHKS